MPWCWCRSQRLRHWVTMELCSHDLVLQPTSKQYDDSNSQYHTKQRKENGLNDIYNITTWPKKNNFSLHVCFCHSKWLQHWVTIEQSPNGHNHEEQSSKKCIHPDNKQSHTKNKHRKKSKAKNTSESGEFIFQIFLIGNFKQHRTGKTTEKILRLKKRKKWRKERQKKGIEDQCWGKHATPYFCHLHWLQHWVTIEQFSHDIVQ